MNYDLLVRGGRLVNDDGVLNADVAIKDGRIVAVAAWDTLSPAKEEIDASGYLVFPGGVDPHVHFNEPGREIWEGWEHGSRAAAAGGLTTVFDMPLNSTPPLIKADAWPRKQEAASRLSYVDYGFWGGLVDDNIADLKALDDLGVVAYKAFLSESGVDFTRAHDGIVYEGLNFARDNKAIIGVHAENDSIASHLGQRMMAEGRTDRRAWVDSRPAFGELEAIKRLIFLAEVTGGHAHVVHVSIADGIKEIYQAKHRGVPVTSETCAHYLWFDDEDFVRIGPAAKCAPPLRDRENREALWERLLAGEIDCVTSDHSPSSPDLKVKGDDNIWEAWGGISGVQVTLPVLFTEGVHKRGMPLTLLVKMWTANAARIFGIYGQKGLIAPGADADLVIFDPEKEWVFKEEDIYSRHKLNAYLGSKFKGAVVSTMLRGRIIHGEGARPEKGYGKLVTKNKTD